MGYGNPKLVEPMQEQIGRLTNVMSAFQTEEIKEAIRQLAEVLPPKLNRAIILNSGSEAVDLALKITRAATGKTGLVVNEAGYFGATAYTFALCSSGRNSKYLPDPGEVYQLPPPTCESCKHGSSEDCKDWKCLELLQKLIDEGNENIAAIIYEPVIGSGIYVPAIGYGEQLRKYADKLSALLISNEITVSPAKSGKWFAHQHDNVIPDILVLGKAIGGGFPVSVIITSKKVEEMCDGSLYHVQSHQNDALSGRAVATVISTIKKNRLVYQCAEKGEYFLKRFRDLKDEFPIIIEVRGRGMLLAVRARAKNEGYVCLILGNRSVRATRIPTDQIIKEVSENIGLKYKEKFERQIINKKIPWKISTNNSSDNIRTISNENILIFQK